MLVFCMFFVDYGGIVMVGEFFVMGGLFGLWLVGGGFDGFLVVGCWWMNIVVVEFDYFFQLLVCGGGRLQCQQWQCVGDKQV